MNNDVLEFLKESNHIEEEYRKWALDDAIEAWNYAESKTELSHGLIREIHFLLIREISPYIAGMYRTHNTQIDGMDCTEQWKIHYLLSAWIERANATQFETMDTETKWSKIKYMHIEFEKIHPFADGNGRVGRILMNWQRKLAGLPILIIHEGDEQHEYYEWFRK